MTKTNSPAKAAPTMIQLGYRVMLIGAFLAHVFIGLWLWHSWHTIKDQQFDRMSIIAGLAAGHSEHYFDRIGSQLQGAAEALKQSQGYLLPEVAIPILTSFKRNQPDLGGASVILPDGQMLFSTLQKEGEPLPNVHTDRAWSEDFNANLKKPGFSVNRPQMGYLQKRWLIILRYTVMDERGAPLFVLQTNLPLEKQQSLWRNLPLERVAAIGLLHENGYLISRLPGDDPQALYRANNWRGPLVQAVYKNPGTGTFGGVTMTGEKRLGAYHRFETLPLYAFLSVPTSYIWQLWWQGVRIPVYILLAFLITAFATYFLHARNFAGRMRVMRERLDDASAGTAQPLPTSGVGEIDDLYEALLDSQQKLKRALRNREKLLLATANAGTYTVSLKDDAIIQADAVFLGMLGMQESELLGRRFVELTIPRAGTKHPEEVALGHRILCLRHKDGRAVWVSTAEYIDNSLELPVRNGLAINVSERERLLGAVRNHSRRLQTLWQLETRHAMSGQEKTKLMLRLGLDTLQMETALIGEVIGEKYILRHVEDRAERFQIGMEMNLKEILCHFSILEKKSLFIANMATDARFSQHPTVTQTRIHAYTSIPIRAGEEIFGTLVFLRQNPLMAEFNDDDKAFVELLAAWFGQLMFAQRQRDTLKSLAMTDSLTQLWNRRAAELQFESEIGRAKRNGENFAVGLCDIDHFKLVNDHYGHDVGDSVLTQVATIMRNTLRDGDWVARWGGEEFIIFMHHSDINDAYVVMERLRVAIKSSPIRVKNSTIEITVSIGIGVTKQEDVDIARVLSEADGCVYDAKKQGRDRVASIEGAHRTLWRAGMLQNALQEKRLVPAYQGIVSLHNSQLVADESLARIILPDGKIVPAQDFIDAAEGINLIHLVDEVIARHAMQRCLDNVMGGLEPPGFIHFINLSPQFLARSELVEALLEYAKVNCQLCDAGDNRKSIVFEITERHFLGDFKRLRSDLEPLLDFGFRLALDDFGSGYSSFLYLAELPFSFLKIEGWMVRNMKHNKSILEMIRSIISLAQTLNIATIAECIEDKETASILRDLGVDLGQGHYFARPVCPVSALNFTTPLRMEQSAG